ncbi:MAG TPA: hypothetical protein VD861_03690, partial [Pyrinomonadaceae bacterium]|nr:hypothetical protein [Pyrinomonadaceae bacterium]
MKRASAVVSAVVAVFLTAASLNPAHSRNTPAPESQPTPAQRTAGPRAEVSRAVFNPDAGYLTFPNREAFDATLNALEDEIKNYKFDKGQTPRLVGLIRDSKNGGEVRDALIRHSPLSEEVLLTFLGRDFPADVVGQVLEENVQFSEKVDAVYLAARLPKEVRQRIDRKRLGNIAYNNPVLQAFESRFAGFQSLRKKRIEAETAFLATGADPDVPSNPANEPTAVDDVLAAVLNRHGEVKVGRDVYISLPDKDVKVADGNSRTLSYIRARGDIPWNPVPGREPDNGFARATAPPPVDAA